MTGTVLVLPAGQMGAVVTRCLQKDSSLRIVSADADFLAPGLHLADRGYLIPACTDAGFFDKIKDIVARESVDVIFPCGNLFTYQIATLAKRFKDIGVKTVVSDLETLDLCTDKWKSHEHLSKIIKMPKTTVNTDIEHIARYIGFPAIIKPRDGSGSKGVHRLDDRDDLQYYLGKVPNPIVQEFIDGEHFAADVLVDANGKPLTIITRQNIEFSDGQPVKMVIEPREDIVQLVKDICEMMKFFGVISINAIIDQRDSKPKLTDINPRAGHGVISTLAAGHNLPLNAVYLALGRSIESVPVNPQTMYVIRYYDEVFFETPSNIDNFK